MTRRTPASTYRLQITPDFDLAAATDKLAYLHDLGADWVYLSPLLEAEPGSQHGYDVIAHDRIDPARGGADGLAALSAEARRLGLGVLVDIVPNHMGVETASANVWWWDVLTHGQGSRFATYFDIDWAAGDGKLLIPIVGDDDEGAISVDSGAREVRYHDHRFPMAPRSSKLERQHYRLVSWREADHHLNYRRFFAVNTLAGIRVEDRAVFDDSHVEIKRWFDEGLVDGLRVDHPDGVRDPEGYLRDLAELTGGAYVLVEKILEPGEELPKSWATAGTTGYDALALVDRVLTDPDGVARLPGAVDWPAMVHGTKRAVADTILGSETRRLVRELPAGVVAAPAKGLGRLRRNTGGLTPEMAIDAMAELLTCFGVYRSYLPVGREHFDAAVRDARSARGDLAEAFDALVPVLSDPAQPAALRFQQTSGMVMAKGVEDCAFYRFSQLTSLTEVGADPSLTSVSVAEWHDAMAVRQAEWPDAMTTLTTHDTKRSEDVRARIAVLAEAPQVWADALDRLRSLAPSPDPTFASLLWQAVVGAWPDASSAARPEWRDRLHAYAEKAMREAGDNTTWTAPDEAFEAAVHQAVDAAFDVPAVAEVVAELVGWTSGPGFVNAVSAKLLALTMPGVPDVYQGSELWEQSLVDPDNRRPVDYRVRRELIAESRPERRDHDARWKLATVVAALRLRRDSPELFTTYAAVSARGEAAGHVLAFDRGGAITVTTRLPLGLAASGGWGETELMLPEGVWWDQVTGRDLTSDGTVYLSELLDVCPVALLVKAES